MPLAIDLTGKRALVTGASDGVGAGVAQVLAQAGCHVAGTGSVPADHPRARAFCKRVARHGVTAAYLSGDLHDPAVPARLVDEAIAVLGGLDIVISNAGRNSFHGAAASTEQDWQDCMNLNLASPLAGFITGNTILMDCGRSALMQDNQTT